MSFDIEQVRAALHDHAFANVTFVAQTASTNDDAARVLGEPAAAGLVISADTQTAGRGRRNRRWIATPNSCLLFTAILPLELAAHGLWSVPFWCALGVADGIARSTGLACALQWPNDLLLGGRKCCGILCISRVTGERAAVACGVGLNVIRPADESKLAEINPSPAFLSDVAPAVTRETLLIDILREFGRRLPELAAPENVARSWEQRANLDGTRYRILRDDGERPFDGIARRLGDGGALILDVGGQEVAVEIADARVLPA